MPLTGRSRAAVLGRAALLAVFGSLLLWASAKIQVPFWPVPMTLQTGVVLLIGVAYGWRLGAATVLLYLAQAAIGWPVLAGTPEKGIGLAYMAGPTGGYLAGFLAAAAIAGFTSERASNWLMRGLGLLAASLAVYLLGVVWLSQFVGIERALLLGVVPFLLGDLVKLLLVWAATEAGLRRLAIGAPRRE